MDRRLRHVVVVGVAVLTAALASFGVYLTLKRMPVREVEVARTFVVVAARALPTGVRLAAADLKVVPWPSSSMVAGGFCQGRGRRRPRPALVGRRKRAAGGQQAGVAQRRRRTVVRDPGRHARDVREGQRRDRRRRIPRPRDARRPDGHDPPQGRQHVADRREQPPGADLRHARRSAASEGRQAERGLGRRRDAARVARGRRAHRARAGGRPDHALAAQPARHRADGELGRPDGGPVRPGGRA